MRLESPPAHFVDPTAIETLGGRSRARFFRVFRLSRDACRRLVVAIAVPAATTPSRSRSRERNGTSRHTCPENRANSRKACALLYEKPCKQRGPRSASSVLSRARRATTARPRVTFEEQPAPARRTTTAPHVTPTSRAPEVERMTVTRIPPRVAVAQRVKGPTGAAPAVQSDTHSASRRCECRSEPIGRKSPAAR